MKLGSKSWVCSGTIHFLGFRALTCYPQDFWTLLSNMKLGFQVKFNFFPPLLRFLGTWFHHYTSTITLCPKNVIKSSSIHNLHEKNDFILLNSKRLGTYPPSPIKLSILLNTQLEYFQVEYFFFLPNIIIKIIN